MPRSFNFNRRPARKEAYDRSAYRSQHGARAATRRRKRGESAEDSDALEAMDALYGSSEEAGSRRTRTRRGARGGASSDAAFGRDSYSSKNPYSRESSNHDYGEVRKKRKRHRVAITALVVLLVLVLGGGGAAFAYMVTLQSSLNAGVDDAVLDALTDVEHQNDPFYMLLMGTDGSNDRAEQSEFRGDNFRTDSLMLARIDPTKKNVAIVSLMRDTQVDMGEYGVQKINAAHAIGGAAYTVEVVSELAGVPISHYAEINFDGFRDVVNALGGIDVNVAVEIDDPEAGGYVAAGQQTLDGDEALILCRSRHTYEEINGRGDDMRAANQRLVIGAILKKVLQSDVGTMMATVQSLATYVTTDFSIPAILGLANDMRGMNLETDFYTAVNPTESQYIDGVWWEILDEPAWKAMMKRMDSGQPPAAEAVIDPATGIVLASGGEAIDDETIRSSIRRSGTVAVRNGTGATGVAAKAQESVESLGYSTTVGNADSYKYTKTEIVYKEAKQEKYAEEIRDALGCGEVIRDNGDYLFTTDFLVITGADFEGED